MNHTNAACRTATAICVAAIAAAMLSLTGCSSSPDAGGFVPQDYAFWPVLPADPRVQYLRSYRSSLDISPRRDNAFSKMVFGDDEGASAAGINKPYGVAMRDAKIYVCDSRNNSLTVLDLKRKQMRLVGMTGFNQLSNPVDVAIADDGMIYVADNERGGVLVFDAQERFAKAMGHDGLRPVGLEVFGDRLYVCNLANQQVEIFDRMSGEMIGAFGGPGDEDGQFRVPLGIDIDKEGFVYVCDMMRCRIQKFTPDGELVAAVGALGDVAGSFARPKQIAVDSDGIIYVVDASFNNVQMFNADFELLMAFGSAGTFPGAMNLPAGICVDEDSVRYLEQFAHPGFDPVRLVVVTNQFGPDKVAVYAFGHRREGWTVADLSENSADVSEGVGENPDALRLQIPADAVDPEAPDGQQ